MSEQVEIRVTAKAQNAILARLVDEFGSQVALCKELGISTGTFSGWLNFRTTLKCRQGKGLGSLGAKRAASIIIKLEKLTGRNIRDIFPKLTKEELSLLAKKRVQEATVQRTAITSSVETKYLTYEHDFTLPEKTELAEKIHASLDCLNERERKIISEYYGLDGQGSRTLDEVGKTMGLHKSRVGQIKEVAIRKLQQPCHSHELVGFLEG